MSADGFPPPPPPNLAPPPGAIGYESGPWGAVQLRRVSGIAKALVILLAIVAVGQLINALLIPGQIDDAEDFLTGRIDEDAYLDEQIGSSAVSLITGAVSLAIIVLSVIWLYRIAANHRALRRQTTFPPGFAIAGWLLPPLLYIIPALMVREHWKAAEPASPPGDESWRRSPEPVLVWVWFLLYSVVPLVLLFSGSALFFGGGLSSDAEDLADSIADSETALWLSVISSFLSAIAWALVVRGLTARHTRFTGEDRAR